MERSCGCGCDSFRFKWESEVADEQVFANICQNCNHTLAEHIKIARTKQAD